MMGKQTESTISCFNIRQITIMQPFIRNQDITVSILDLRTSLRVDALF